LSWQLGIASRSITMARLIGECATAVRSLTRSPGVPTDTGPAGDQSPTAIGLDCMERGLPRKFVADVVESHAFSNQLRRFQVQRSAGRREFRLLREDQTFLLFARVSKAAPQVDIFMEDPAEVGGSRFDAARPTFSLVCCSDRKTEWELLQHRCDGCWEAPQQAASCQCGGRRRLMRVQQASLEPTGAANHSMTAELLSAATAERYTTKVGGRKFEHRSVLHSAKNFQLTAQDHGAEGVLCQHAKIAEEVFCLDFKHPVSMIQAFSLSLSTLFWV